MAISSAKKAKGGDGLPFAISLAGVTKRFGEVLANDNVSIDITAGSIHGIVGENGAGKSTLVSILYGFYQADQGQIAVDGQVADIRSASDAIATGIGMVHQHFMLVATFTVLENIILGHEFKDGLRNLKDAKVKARDKLTRLSEDYGLAVDLDAKIENLSVGLQQRVEILKALYRGARILILDEPTGVLTPQETEQLFSVLRSLRGQGVTIVLITHKLREVMAITDHVSVMRGGKMIDHLLTAETSPEELAQLMVGRKVLVNADYHDAAPQDGKPQKVKMKVRSLTLIGRAEVPLLRGIDFDLKAGEILGIAGVSGNGQSELLDVLSGITPPTAGTVEIGGQVIAADSGVSPRDIKELGVAHVPEDRHAVGIVLPFSAAESAVLGYEDQPTLGSWQWLSPPLMEGHCAGLMQGYDIRPCNPKLESGFFSGGNQQKLVLAREMSAVPMILLVGQPTRGVDIGAIEFIHQRLIDMRDQGCAILLISVELDEILSLSDRVLVMNGGESMGIVDKKDATPQSIGLMMGGVQ
jgi:simple sugar transport system ATP-binding protein